jgi:glycosyltransferase involved in cell wall biosynthesis
MKLVSIIIPVYNRGHLIGETLDSILSQAYKNWECIIIDDGSMDETKTVVTEYCYKDSRFKSFNRPFNLVKGANACRNYGYELSKGEYINWFDSDDIMENDFIEKKVEVLESENLDFVISNSVNFDEDGSVSLVFGRNNDGKQITAAYFIGNVINWITMDAMITRESIGKLRFNEVLKSGQEYNFYARYLLQKPKGRFINQCLAKRRVHNQSIQEQLNTDPFNKKKELLFNEIILLKDIKGKVPRELIKRSLKRIIRFSYETQKKFTISKEQLNVLRELIDFGNLKVICGYIMWGLTNFIFGRGFFWIKLSNFD